MTRKGNIVKYLSFIALVIFTYACGHSEGEHHSLKDKIEEESTHFKEVPISSEKYLEGINTVSVTENGKTFLIPERTGNIKSFKCTECHTQPLNEMNLNSDKTKKAHWNIELVHAGENVMNCMSCHTANNMDTLHSFTGKSIDFNHSYQLCGQCHSKQLKDWKGGAHGKRLGGWANPRVTQTCVNCHNPHQPAFQPRWPSRFNTQKVKERAN